MRTGRTTEIGNRKQKTNAWEFSVGTVETEIRTYSQLAITKQIVLIIECNPNENVCMFCECWLLSTILRFAHIAFCNIGVIFGASMVVLFHCVHTDSLMIFVDVISVDVVPLAHSLWQRQHNIEYIHSPYPYTTILFSTIISYFLLLHTRTSTLNDSVVCKIIIIYSLSIEDTLLLLPNTQQRINMRSLGIFREYSL